MLLLAHSYEPSPTYQVRNYAQNYGLLKTVSGLSYLTSSSVILQVVLVLIPVRLTREPSSSTSYWEGPCSHSQ